MARQARTALPGYTYHVIQRGNNRQSIFVSDADRREWLQLLFEASREHAVAIHSYVLMDNHVHLLLTPTTQEGLSKLMQQVGRSFVLRFNKRQGRSGTLFEGRFRSALVQSERYLLACMAYIDLNPVRAGMVLQPQDFAWSSYAHYSGGLADRMITPHPHFFNLGNTPFSREKAYQELIQAGLSAPVQTQITQTLLKNHALGDDEFILNLEKKTERRLHTSKAGRPIGSKSLNKPQ
ncbi:MAG: REP-associated tyrosine transposase [Brachymonas sp.]